MGQVSFNLSNTNKPAPKWWRKLENGLLAVLIPGIVAVLMGWKFKDEAFAARLILMINTGIVALIKFIGMMLANGDDYTSSLVNGVASPEVADPPTGDGDDNVGGGGVGTPKGH